VFGPWDDEAAPAVNGDDRTKSMILAVVRHEKPPSPLGLETPEREAGGSEISPDDDEEG
jgi:hypothetical protein